MKNPFENISQKEMLYIAGAVASLIALAFVFGTGKIKLGGSTVPGAVSDAPAGGLAESGGYSPGYTNYNFGPINPEPLADGGDPGNAPAGHCGCFVPSAFGCAGPSQLADGTASSDLGNYLSYLRDINPNYQKLYATQLSSYSEYFAAGSKYSGGVSPVAVALNN